MRFHTIRIVKFVFVLISFGIFINIFLYYISKSEFDEIEFNNQFDSDSLLQRTNKLDPSYSDISQLQYISKNLIIQYNIVANFNNQFVVNIVLNNSGKLVIEKCCWTIYFYHTKYINTIAINSGLIMIGSNNSYLGHHFDVNHVNGYTFSISPSKSFDQFDPGDTKILQIFGDGWVVSKSEVLPNWYVANDKVDLEPKLIESTAGESMSFVGGFHHINQTLRSINWEQATPFTAKSRFRLNDIIDAGTPIKPIIPTPLKIKIDNNELITLNKKNPWKILYTNDLLQEAFFLKNHFLFLSLKKLSARKINRYYIVLAVNERVTQEIPNNMNHLYLQHAYSLIINAKEKKIFITGASRAGVFYGIISLFSLAGISSPDQRLNEIKLPSVMIIDAPRYEHRGVMVDVARNFHTKREIFKLMDALALYKLNVLHLHLADDEGWRIEIPGLSELTKVGGQRSHDLMEEDSLIPMLGSGPNNKTSGSGYYTVQDYKEILRYANNRHIQIIPEIDMPGHSHAAIQSMKARYRNFKKLNKQDSKKYLVSDLIDKSFYRSGQFFAECAMNPCIQSTYRFVDHVLDQFIEMHKKLQPLHRFHFGGDEVPQNAYTGSTACMRFLQANKKVRSFEELKKYFIRQITHMMGKKNLSVIGWEDAYTSENGGQMLSSEIETREAIIQYYLNNWEGGLGAKAYEFANAGYKVILSPITALYFDNPQEPDPNDWGLHWGTRYSNTKRTFHFAPEDIYNSIDFTFSGQRLKRKSICISDDLCPKLLKHENILGLEGAMWSELIRTESRMDSMLWPRMIAVSERSWHRATWETATNQVELEQERDADWVQFANTVGYKELKRLEALNIEYYLPRVGARSKKGKLYLNSMFPGLKFSISLDRGKSWEDYDPQKSYSGLTIEVSTRSSDGKRRSVPIYLQLP